MKRTLIFSVPQRSRTDPMQDAALRYICVLIDAVQRRASDTGELDEKLADHIEGLIAILEARQADVRDAPTLIGVDGPVDPDGAIKSYGPDPSFGQGRMG